MANQPKIMEKIEGLEKLNKLESHKYTLNTDILRIKANKEYSRFEELNLPRLERSEKAIKERIESLEKEIELLRKEIYGKLSKFVVLNPLTFNCIEDYEIFNRESTFSKNGLKYALYVSENDCETIVIIDENGFENSLNAITTYFLSQMEDPQYSKLPKALKEYC